MTRRVRRRLIVSLVVAATTALLITAALRTPLLRTFEFAAYDFFFQTWTLVEVREQARNVVIVAIDDASIRRLGRFGDWPRIHYAHLVDRLREGHARMIVFDVGFIEPHPDDPLVAEAMERFINVPLETLRAQGVPLNRRSVISPVVGTPQNIGRDLRAGTMREFPEMIEPQPVYVAASTALGHANTTPDEDGTVRKTPLLIRAAGREIPALALQAAAAFTNTLNRGLRIDPERRALLAMGRSIPVDDFYQMHISYAGPPSHVFSPPEEQTFRVISFVDVLEGRARSEEFRDKAVFIGLLDATGFADDYNVPTSGGMGKMHGVEIHASTFATLTSAHFLTTQQLPVTTAIVWLMSLATGLVVFRFSTILSALIAVMVGVGYFAGAIAYTVWSYDPAGVAIPNPVFPVLALLVTFLAVTSYRVVFEQAEARATRSVMGKYLSPAVLDEVLKDPEKLQLGGQKRVMSVMFTDIRGFTSISEKLDPEYLTRFLNEYLTSMTDIVYTHAGVLDKYMGDAIMAWWGAPTEQPDHAHRACLTALDMRLRLRELHQRWDAEGVPKLEMGIGINTGPMVYGNTGSRERFDFTVLGDAVNLASRLEGVNKEYGSNIIISEFTFAEVADQGFLTRALDRIAVKGKTEPVRIYELLGLASQLPEETHEVVRRWEIAIALYEARDFALAAQEFERVLAIAPADGPAAVYLERCHALRENPPEPNWDGIFVMTHK